MIYIYNILTSCDIMFSLQGNIWDDELTQAPEEDEPTEALVVAPQGWDGRHWPKMTRGFPENHRKTIGKP